MRTIFVNTKNSKTNEPHRSTLSLIDKLNVKDPNKNMALTNLSIYYTWKYIKSATINLKFLLQLGMMNLICLMDLILLQTSKTTLNLSSKNTQLYLKILLYKFTLIKCKSRIQTRIVISRINEIIREYKKRY